MTSELLIRFAALFISAKLMGLRLPFYSAAIFAVGSLYVIESLSAGHFGPLNTQTNGIRLVAAFILFFLLDRNEKKTGRWLLLFAVTCAAFAYIVP